MLRKLKAKRQKFTYVYPCETQEMLFDAHVRAFKFFGGVPKYGIYDNMKTAVKKILRGKNRDWCHYASKIVQCKAYADKLVFVYRGTEIAEHVRRFNKGQTYYNWKHYLPILMRKPGALRNGAPFKDMGLPEELQIVRRHLHQQRASGAKDFVQILSYIPQMSIEAVQTACSQAIRNKTISSDVILNILLRSEEDPIEENQPVPDYLLLKFSPIADCSRYNTLLRGVATC